LLSSVVPNLLLAVTLVHSSMKHGTLVQLLLIIKIPMKKASLLNQMISSIGGLNQEVILRMIQLFFGSLVDQDAHLKLLFSSRMAHINSIRLITRHFSEIHTLGTTRQTWFMLINQSELVSPTLKS